MSPSHRRRQLRRRVVRGAAVVLAAGVTVAVVAVIFRPAPGVQVDPTAAMSPTAAGTTPGVATTSLPASGATSAAPGTGTVGGSGDSPAGTGGSGSPPATTVTPTAPTGFSSQVTGLYSDIYAAVQATGIQSLVPSASATLPTPAQYDKLISQLSGSELGQFYQSTQGQPGWTKLPATYRSLASTATQMAKATATGSAGPPKAKLVSLAKVAAMVEAAQTFPPAAPTGPFPAAPPAYTPNPAVAPADVASCPPGAPGADGGEAGIYGAQVAADVSMEVAVGLPSMVGAIVAGTPATIPDPARIAAEVSADAAELLGAAFQYVENIANDCGDEVALDTAANIDNTTVNSYDLLTTMESTLDAIENSVDTISSQVDVLQQTLDDQLTLTIEEDLAAPATTVPNLAFELPASAGGNLDSTPVGVQSIVTQSVRALTTAGDPVDGAAPRYLAQANASLAAGDDAQAYSDFHLAYLDAVG